MLTGLTRKSLVESTEIANNSLLKLVLKLKNNRIYHNQKPSNLNEICLYAKYLDNITDSKEEYIDDSLVPKIIQKINSK